MSNNQIEAYDRLVGMMSQGNSKWVDKSEVVPPDVFREQDEKGQLDKESLAQEIGFIAEMIVEFASDIADEAVEGLMGEAVE